MSNIATDTAYKIASQRTTDAAKMTFTRGWIPLVMMSGDTWPYPIPGHQITIAAEDGTPVPFEKRLLLNMYNHMATLPTFIDYSSLELPPGTYNVSYYATSGCPFFYLERKA